MKYGSLVLERKDYRVLKKYLKQNLYIEDYSHKDALDTLEDNLKTALIFEEEDMPDDIIGFNSMVTVSSISKFEYTFQLVSPLNNDPKNGKVSVTSTMGSLVIGKSQDDIINYGPPAGSVSLKICKVGNLKLEKVEV